MKHFSNLTTAAVFLGFALVVSGLDPRRCNISESTTREECKILAADGCDVRWAGKDCCSLTGCPNITIRGQCRQKDFCKFRCLGSCKKAAERCVWDPKHPDADGYKCVKRTSSPTSSPTNPSESPSASPTVSPTGNPVTSGPTAEPSFSPTGMPSFSPTSSPTVHPTASPTNPTAAPTGNPVTSQPTPMPTFEPTAMPTHSPTKATEAPTLATEAPGTATEAPSTATE